MSVRFYFVRHGQSTANLKNEYYNDREAGLTDLGRIQAAKVGCDLKKLGKNFKIIFCSPYRRAVETCKIALEKADLDCSLIIEDEQITERKFDGLIGKRATKKQNRMLYYYGSDQAEKDGVETLEALEQRARSFINKVVQNYPDSDILIFSHGAFGLAFRAAIEGRPESGNLFDLNLLKNGEIAIFEVR